MIGNYRYDSGDIWGVASSDIPDHDLLVGGFPCQPFSTLGPQRGLADTKPGPCVAPDVWAGKRCSGSRHRGVGGREGGGKTIGS